MKKKEPVKGNRQDRSSPHFCLSQNKPRVLIIVSDGRIESIHSDEPIHIVKLDKDYVYGPDFYGRHGAEARKDPSIILIHEEPDSTGYFDNKIKQELRLWLESESWKWP